MSIFLDRIDSAPISNLGIDPQFLQWLWVLVDSLNENLSDIESAFNLITLSGYTQTEITDMNSDGDLADGIILYDTTNNVYVGRQSGSLVKFTVGAYP